MKDIKKGRLFLETIGVEVLFLLITILLVLTTTSENIFIEMNTNLIFTLIILFVGVVLVDTLVFETFKPILFAVAFSFLIIYDIVYSEVKFLDYSKPEFLYNITYLILIMYVLIIIDTFIKIKSHKENVVSEHEEYDWVKYLKRFNS